MQWGWNSASIRRWSTAAGELRISAFAKRLGRVATPASLPSGAINLSALDPDWTLFPFPVWNRLLRRHLRRMHSSGHRHASGAAGHDALRETIASYLARSRAVRCRAEQIVVVNGSQQQWFTRNSVVGSWTNGVWNQVFAGVEGAPAECFPAAASCGGPYTTLATSPVTREAPYLYVDDTGRAAVFLPAPRTDSAGVSWADGPEAGRSIPLSDFLVASPANSAREMSTALARGENLLLTPGVAVPPFEAKRPEDWELSLERFLGWTPFSYPFNLTQQPAAVVPCGLTRSGLPIAVQIVGPMHGDALVLRAARAYESTREWKLPVVPRYAP